MSTPRLPIFSYAETHFRFNLPWSPLHKPWPELFLDAPHQLVPGKDLTVWLLAKDADLFPARIRSVTLRLSDDHGATATHVFEPSADEGGLRESLQYLAFTLPRSALAPFRGLLRITGFIAVENQKGERRTVENHNYPGLEPWPLEVHLLGAPLPYPAGWRAGELHCHSEFTSDHVEFGAPLALLQETAAAVGLDFVLCTDHSYDFPYRRDRYLEPTDAEANFAAYRAQALGLNTARPELPTLIPGEEISCGNARGQNVHLLAFGHPAYIPGEGDGGRRGLRNRPDLTIGEVLERLGDTPAFAAHPSGHRNLAQRLVLNRGPWRAEDITAARAHRNFAGLQFWNGSLNREYGDGKALWVHELLRGSRLLPLGANDAHGDFNIARGVKVPLISLRQSRSHVFGRVRTLVPSAGRAHEDLCMAFSASPDSTGTSGGMTTNPCICTDGPFAALTRREDGSIRIRAVSTADFGPLVSIVVLGADSGDNAERVLREWTFDTRGPLALDEAVPSSLLPMDGYARLEVVTQRGRRALTGVV